ncbi:MAG TPA: ABC transporter six-transmembrane domain-containing protein [Buttiauxella sp.]|uniref:ABC transporter six-transmembrane domain-containing protein n=1 Tax=Buttiauxella sp. TaxID=1972222 RepID=UPI002B49A0E3|nr:ABC transporter six-transmembrane domain-containing protein [Buttiauxella sp.]HKM98825.1 ABC transporter six-transmembrane domain-containing protein [Buttiauxella sp.]
MSTCQQTAQLKPSNGALNTLKKLAKLHSKKLVVTLLLVVAENVVYLLYPLMAGFAINAIINGQSLHALLYALVVFIMWAIGAARRSMDTRTFARIYAGLAVPVILEQRKNDHSHSTIAARVTLSREFVNFFETHLPLLMTSLASIIGAVVMLLTIEFWAGVACLAVMVFFALFLPSYTRKNELLYEKLNDRLEKEVGFVGTACENTLNKHYNFLALVRIRLSDREAYGYLAIGIAAAFLFAMTIWLMTMKGVGNAGHIYSVMTYMWMFAMSLDDGPSLLEKYSQLKEIGKRVNTGLVD